MSYGLDLGKRAKGVELSISNMLCEDAEGLAFCRASLVENVRCNALDHISQQLELCLPFARSNTSFAGKIVESDTAYLTVDYPCFVHHRKFEGHLIGVVNLRSGPA
jgi:hypothetical protein